ADYKNITLVLEENGTVSAKMNPDLAHVLVINLIKNAIVHNHPSGEVHVILEDQALSFINSRKSEALNGARMLDRSYKQGSNGPSTGLGLAIVKAIADLYGFRIAYRFEEKHEFKIIF